MLRPCSECGKPSPVYLHHGQLYCYRCVPIQELPLPGRFEWMIQRARLSREEATRRLEQLLARRAK